MSDAMIYVAKRNAGRTIRERVAQYIVDRSDEDRGCSRCEIAQALNLALVSIDVALRELAKLEDCGVHPGGTFTTTVKAITHMGHAQRGEWFAPAAGRHLLPTEDGRKANRFVRREGRDYLVIPE